MIKVNVFLTRRPDLTLAEFTDYWSNHHTALLATMPATKKYTRRYVQLHRAEETIAGLPTAPYDGIAEVWVDDMEAAASMFTNDFYKTVIAEDEANFIDRSKTVLMYSTEDVISV
jgi:uncharacterized protein (TIGR02118 family)